MILVSDVIKGVAAELDATGSGRYDNERDYFPAINKAQDWLVAVFNGTFGTNKITEESLRELVVTRVFLCNQFSRLNLYDSEVQSTEVLFQDHIWSILAVHPNCKVVDENGNDAPSPSVLSNKFQSKMTPFIMVPDIDNTIAERKSLEEWSGNVDDNMFARGSAKVTNGFSSFSYINWNENKPFDPAFTVSDQSLSTGPEIEIKPAISNKYVAVTYLRSPARITATTNQIGFPVTLSTLIVARCIDYITRKAYDREPLYQVTQQDVSTLISLMT